jgi:gamma-glutamyltranspeptidase/glutathione hydrolase
MDPISHCSGTGAVAVTPHHAATDAALDVMSRGGTAADAVVAANAVLGMVVPTTCGIGGDFFAIVHSPGMDRPAVLNASGRGGSGLDAASMRAAGLDRMEPYGPASISVPGCVDGWYALNERYGSASMAALIAPAIELGTEGFAVSLELADALDRLTPSLQGQPAAAALYPEGAPAAEGATVRRPDLAATLDAIGRDGRDAFYSGEVAEAIASATSGILTTEDLASNRPDWVEPLGIEVFGHHGWTVPPNSQGYLTLATAWAFEHLGPPADPNDPRYHHGLIEAYRAFAWERNDVVADQAELPWDLAHYLDPTRLAERAATIDPDRAVPRPTPSPGPPGTAYFCAVDGDGMAVSAIQSNYFGIGSRVSAGATGVFLHNRGAGFSLIEGHPNEARGGRRPLHTLSPTLWTRDGVATLVLGTRGGDQQPQYLAQMAAATLFAGFSPAEAQAEPRWSMTAVDTDRSRVAVEPGLPDAVRSGLAERGHDVMSGPERTPGWGPVSIVSIDAAGVRRAAADPRVSTASAGMAD